MIGNVGTTIRQASAPGSVPGARTAGCRRALAWPLLALALALAPPAATAACSGRFARLQAYAGQYLASSNLLATPEVAVRLRQLPVDTRSRLDRNLDVSGPIELAACHLVMSGNAAHMGTEEDALLDIDVASGTVVAGIHDRGRIDIYVIEDPGTHPPPVAWNGLPRVVREWAVKADMGFPQQQPRDFMQPRSVRLHLAAAPPMAETVTPRMQPSEDARPTAAQTDAIRLAAGDIADCGQSDRPCYAVSLADLNDDGRADLIVQSQSSTWCGSAGCGGVIVMATAGGYARKAIGLPNYTEIAILASTHHGMHDLEFDSNHLAWQWDGNGYDLDYPVQPGSDAEPWQTARAPGHPLTAYAAPIDSTIKHLLVFCEQGQPLLAMLTKMPRPEGAVTLTFVFRGWTVNVPMQRNGDNPNLWVSNLARSDLPQWLAHRGNTPTTRSLAQAATIAYLRTNGAAEGEISLEHSTAATRGALGSCYRY